MNKAKENSNIVPPLGARGLLVIRFSAMGDVAMTVPVLIALTHKYPELNITVLTKSFYKPIVEQVPNVTVYAADVKEKHKGVLGLWKLYKELIRLHITAVADLHNVLRSTILKQFFKLGGIPVVQIDKGRAEKKALTSSTNKVFKPLKTTTQRYTEVFQELGLPITLDKSCVLQKRHLAKELKEGLGVDGEQCIGVAPFAAFKGKEYPINLMEEVLQKLNDFKNYKILLFGGGEVEKQQLEIWENKFTNCTSVVGKVSFAEELKLISNLDLMLAMDSGNAHLAAMYGVPTITLWGVTHPYAGFYPFGQEYNTILSDREKFPLIPTSVYGNKFPTGYDKAMETIAPEQILQKILHGLSQK